MALEPPIMNKRPVPHDWGRRRLVAFGKVAAPAVGLLVILALVGLPLLASDPIDSPDREERAGEGIDLSAGMVGPRFEGVDGQGRPFVVRAETADFASEDQRFVQLERPKGDLSLSDGSEVAITAASGVYDREVQFMQLAGDVTLFHDDGFEVVTDSAVLDIPGGRAEGSEPVAGEGPVGHIVSEGFRIEEDGARVLFTGRSRLVLYGDQVQEGRLP